MGTVEECRARCAVYHNCLLISSIAEVNDIADIDETLATRPAHEELTEQAAALLREQGENPYILSTQACAICERCAILDNQPCRFPEKMHPCVESQRRLSVLYNPQLATPYKPPERCATVFCLL